MRETQPSYRGEEKMQAGSGDEEGWLRGKVLSRGADEIPFAPGERFVDGNEMRARNFSNKFGLGQPLRVRSNLVLSHGRESIHFVRKAAHHRNFRDKVHEGEKGSAPRLDKHDAAIFAQHALHFRKSLIEVIGQRGQMVQAPLHDKDVFAAIRERKFAAIGDGAFRGTFELREQTGREVHAFDASETEALEGNQTVSAAAKKFDNFGVAPPVARAQAIEPRDKFLNFLLGRFETQVGGFPRIRGERVRCLGIYFVSRRFYGRWRHFGWAEE